MSSTRSKFLQRAAIVVLAAVGAALPQIVTAQGDGLVGKWILVPERSNSGPRALQGDDRHLFRRRKGLSEDQSKASMRRASPIKGTFEVVFDQKPHPVTGIPDYDSATWQQDER